MDVPTSRTARGRLLPPLLLVLGVLTIIAAGNRWVYGRIRSALDDDLGSRLRTIASLLVETELIDGTALYSDGEGFRVSELEWIDPVLRRIQENNDLDAILLLDPMDYIVCYSSSAQLYTPGNPYPWLEVQSTAILEAVEGRTSSVSATVRVGRGGGGVYLKSSFTPVYSLLGDEPVALLVVEASPDFFVMLGLLRRTMYTGTLLAALLLLLLMATWLGLQRRIDRAQAALEREDRMTALGRLASQVAHEIRNPVGIIKYSAQRLGRWLEAQGGGRRDIDPELAEMVAYIGEETVRLQSLTERYLTYTRDDRTQRRPIVLADLVASTVTALSRMGLPEGIRMETEMDDDLPPLVADPEQLRQALLNLGANAAEAMGTSGTLTLFARRSDPRRGRAGGDGLRIGIRDTGPGIPERLRQRIFEPFFTTREEGNGLGLHIVGRIARAHGGSAAVGEAPGGGAEVWIELPPRRSDDESEEVG